RGVGRRGRPREEPRLLLDDGQLARTCRAGRIDARLRPRRRRLSADAEFHRLRGLHRDAWLVRRAVVVLGATLRRLRVFRSAGDVDGDAACVRSGRDADAAGHHRSGGGGSRARALRNGPRPQRPRRGLRLRIDRGARHAPRVGTRPRNSRSSALAAVAWPLLLSTPSFAQTTRRVEFRPFGIFAVERFTAATTFDATLDSSFQPLWGGGVEINTRRNVFVDVTVTRLSRTGQQ